jgi:ABC-type branched-subunit amino acid transport system ATPase component
VTTRCHRRTHYLEAQQVTLRFGGITALTDVSFAIRAGELFSIIGPNGAGKTSMVNCISGRSVTNSIAPVRIYAEAH